MMIRSQDCTDILTGQLTDLPCLYPSTIKIYVCSNFGEFDDERRFIWQEILPDLQDHCMQYGYDVIFVDMLLGNQSGDHGSEAELNVRLAEIEKCRRESTGPFFLVLLGDNYGNVPLPDSLDENEFKQIAEVARLSGKDNQLLGVWYKKDENAIPPVYKLNPKFDLLRDEDHKAIHLELMDLIQAGAKSNPIINKDFVNNSFERFFVSGLEKQIKLAMKECVDQCLFVFRSFKSGNELGNVSPPPLLSPTMVNSKNNFFMQDDFKNDVSSTKSSIKSAISITTSPHIYLCMNQSTSSLSKLKTDILSGSDSDNVIKLTVNAARNEIETVQRHEFDDYLEHVISCIATKLREMIDRSVNNQKQIATDPANPKFDYKEVLVHLHHCVSVFNKTQACGSVEKTLAQLQSLVVNGTHTEHQLMILKGSEDCEVSSISALLCHRVRDLYGKDTILIPIFVGLTTKSNSMENIFRTICSQINIVLNQDVNIEGYTHKKLASYFLGLVNRVTKSSHHLFICIDGIDKFQSLKDQETELFDWLACRLPAKCHILVTSSSVEGLPIMKYLETKLINTDGAVYVGKMSGQDCKAMLDQTLSHAHRKLTDKQYNTVINAISQTKCPTVIGYLSQLAKSWTSDNTIGHEDESSTLPTSIETMVEHIVSKLESDYGRTVTMTLLSYLTLARYGVTEVELLDLMSSKDSVLLAMYNQQEPIVLRFASNVWVYIQRTLEPILSKRYISGKALLTWANKTCHAVIRQKYLESTEDALAIHQDFADLYLENWSTQNPFLSDADADIMIEGAERMLQPQPLVYNTMMYNLRKLQELWWHLLNSGDIEKFKENTFCNFEYLLAMADTDGIQSLIQNIEMVKGFLLDADIHILELTLKSSGLGLHLSPLQLSNEIIGRLRQIKDFYPEYIDPLISQAMEWCDSYSFPLLVPLTKWLDNIHVPLVTSMPLEEPILCAAMLPNSQHILLAIKDSIDMYHIPTQRLVKSFHGLHAKVTCLHLNTTTWALYAGVKDKTMNMWNLNSETCMKTFYGFKSFLTSIQSFGESHVICGTDGGAIQVKMIYDESVIARLELHRKRITALQLCKSDTILVSGSLDGKIIVWYTVDWVQMNTVDPESLGPVLCLSISTDGTFIVAGTENRSLHVIALATGTVAQTIKVKNGNITSVSICKDCHHCVAGCTSGEVILYNFRTTEILNVYKQHKSEIIALMLNDCHQLAVSVSKNDVHVWSLLKCYTKHVYRETHNGIVKCIAVTKDNKRLITGSIDGLLKTWMLDISDFADNFMGHSGQITCIALADDNTFVVSGSMDKSLKVWSLTLASVITNYKGHEASVRGVEVLSDNHQVLSMDILNKIHMWRAEDGQTIRLYEGPTGVYCVAPNSQFCVSGSGDNRLQIWKITDGTVIKEVSHKDKITCLLCSKDCEYLVTGSIDKSVKVWELATGKLVQVIVEFKCPVRSIVITENNETIVSGCDNGYVHLCSLSLGISQKKLKGHVDSVTVVCLSSDDTVLVSGSTDNTVRVWAVKQGISLALFDCHYPILDLMITENAHRVAVHLADNKHVPILCLHNTPSRAKSLLTLASSSRPISMTSSSTMDISVAGSRTELSEVSFDFQSLPIKPRPPTRNRCVPSLFPVPPRRRRLSSASSIPQIIQHSPIRAPMQSTMKEQEQRRLKLPIPKINIKPQKSPSKNSKSKDGSKRKDHSDQKGSNVCSIV